MIRHLSIAIILIGLSVTSCQNVEENITEDKQPSEQDIIRQNLEEYAIDKFKESRKTGTAEARNIRVDTILVISSRNAERIKARKFERDYEMFCKWDSLPYSKELEQDSLQNWLKRAEKLPNNDTVGYRVKYNLDYVIKGELSPSIWIKSFDRNFES
jgi:hypothetical protein